MSKLYLKVSTGFFSHRKTLRLSVALGNDAFWIPPRLWAYAVENQPDGDFSKYQPEEIARVIGYIGDALGMLEALLKVGFMDDNPLRIHEWGEHNAYHKTYAERAVKAANARWSKKSPSRPSPDKDKGERERVSIAPSNASSIKDAPTLNECEIPSWSEWWGYCQSLNCGLVAEWYARDKFQAAHQGNWKGKENWRAYAGRCKTWWEQDGRPMQPRGSKPVQTQPQTERERLAQMV